MAGSSYLYGGLALIGAALLAPSLKPREAPLPVGKPLQAPAESPSLPPIGNGVAFVELERAPDSHFYADAQVNGASVRFIVDTGATSVVLTQADAQRAGLLGGEYSARGKTANGEVRLMPITIERLGLGPLTAEHVPAMVAEHGLEVSLLGQSYLQRVQTVAIQGDRMVLR
jgi:aspartyl protease family protein